MNAQVPDYGREEAEKALRGIVGTIRKLRVVFYNEDDDEIASLGPYRCSSGESITVEVPDPGKMVFTV